ncbi:MAG: primary-amine oxidase [Granulosicoccus sp.]|nr:primary-amine oxidase [Granulosicoccus sp.]
MSATLDRQDLATTDVSVNHPLDPLGGEEISVVSELLKGHFKNDPNLLFETIELLEPEKDAVHGFSFGKEIPRAARFTLYKRGETGVWKGTVDINQETISHIEFLADARPMISSEEFLQIEEAAKASPEFKAAMSRRGIEDLSLVCVDPWSAGNFGVPGEENKRLAHTYIWMRMFELDNYYAHPVEGVNVVVDIDRMEVVRVDDHDADSDSFVPVPQKPVNYDSSLLTEFREPLKPLDVIQTEGPSFTMDGNKLTWDNWDVRIGFSGREGLVLHQLGYTHGGSRRPVAYRLSLAEMVVPYGTPEGVHYRKNVFDSGEYGFGKLVNSLSLGCDCLGHIHYVDVVLHDLLGNPTTVPSAICIHEEDAGLAWKHYDFRTDRTETRRTRKLVISSITTVGNYEYCCYWYLFQDGTIEFEMKATGIINTVGCVPGSEQKYGTEVSPGVVGYNHQHVFCMRMDMEVDGANNTVVECDTIAPDMGLDNPMGNAFYVQEKALTSESRAQRQVDFNKARYWKVINSEHKNAMGKPTGYKLETPSAIPAYTHPEGPSGKRSKFMYNHLWVTQFNPEERYPAGEFMNHSTGEDGISAWTQQDRPLENTDVVLWHTFGLHHVPRMEDHPVQPCVLCGFKLVPTNFFDSNPLIDLPPETNKASKSTLSSACCDS